MADLYALSQKAYVLLKTAYVTREAGLSSLEGKRTSLLEKIESLISTQEGVNEEIGSFLSILKNANLDNENLVYGFLPSDNEKYLQNYDGSAFSAFCEESGEQTNLVEIDYSIYGTNERILAILESEDQSYMQGFARAHLLDIDNDGFSELILLHHENSKIMGSIYTLYLHFLLFLHLILSTNIHGLNVLLLFFLASFC